MTDRLLPHASTVINGVLTMLIRHGENKLADDLAAVHRATCDFVHYLLAEREAQTAAAINAARNKSFEALQQLRTSRVANNYFTARDE